MTPAPLGFVTGLTAEARIARTFGGLVRAGGGTPEGAAEAAEALVRDGVSGLVSFGLAGGLSPTLRPGALVVPGTVIEGDGAWSTDPDISARFGGVTANAILAGTSIVATAAEKSRLFSATGAVAVDLESGAVARVAEARGLPFAVLRTICDPADRDLPPAALVALDQRGAIGLLRVIASVIAHPWQLPGLLALARDAGKARAALLQVSVRDVAP